MKMGMLAQSHFGTQFSRNKQLFTLSAHYQMYILRACVLMGEASTKE